MKKNTFFSICFIGLMLFSNGDLFAQTMLEMASGAGNPTGVGPTQTTTITLQDNTNNPTGNTFLPANNPVSVTYTLQNHNTTINGYSGTYRTTFGYSNGNGSSVFPTMNFIGTSTNSLYTSGSTVGSGIDATTNRAVEMIIFTYPLYSTNSSRSGEVKVCELKIDFSRAVSNPIIHITGMGGSGGSRYNNYTVGFNVLGGYTLNRLSGMTNFVTVGTRINNNATTVAASGIGSATGSVCVNGTNITSLTLELYFRGDGSGSWPTSTTSGEAFTLGVSVPQNVLVANNDAFTVVEKNNTTTTSVLANDTYNGSVDNTSNVNFTWVTPPSGFTANNNGTLSVGPSVLPGTYAINYTICDKAETGNCKQGTATITVLADSDGDGIPDIYDLDNDNDGILDSVEKYCDTSTAPNGTYPVSTTPPTTPAYTKQLLFFDWSGVTLSPSTTFPVSKSVTTSNGITYTATISNYTSTADDNNTSTTNDKNLTGTDIKTWSGGPNQMIWKYYNVNGTTFKEALYTATNVTGVTSFDITFKATKDGVTYPVDAVVFDAESTYLTDGEQIKFVTNAGNFTLLEKTGTGTISSDNITGGGTNTVTYKDTQNSSVNALFVTSGYNPKITASLTMALNSLQGVGFAVRVYCDVDNDGIPNFLDTDSDGDGCPDAIEGGDNVTPLQLNSLGQISVKADGTTQGTQTEIVSKIAAANGVPELVNPSAANTSGVAGTADANNAVGQAIGTTQDNTKNVCKNLWVGTTDNAWNKPNNWKSTALPIPGTDIEFATSSNNGGVAAANDMQIPVDSNFIIGNLTNQSTKATVIPAGSGLTVNGVVTGSNLDPNKIQIQADGRTLTDESTRLPNGTLILSGQPCSSTVLGTVQMFTKGAYNPDSPDWKDNITNSPTLGNSFDTKWTWQFFGVPVETMQAVSAFYGLYVREYDETLNASNSYYMKWRELNTYSQMKKFKGYELTHKTPKQLVTMQGKLVFCDQDITLTKEAPNVKDGITSNSGERRYGLGQNLFGNSFTAAIPINQIDFNQLWIASNNSLVNNTSGAYVEKTVYLYNTGSFGNWATPNGGTPNNEYGTSGTLAGQYRAIPRETAPAMGYTNIPSMNGFLLNYIYGGVAPATAVQPAIKMKIPYGKVVKNNKPQTAPRFKAASSGGGTLSYLQINLQSNSTVDDLWLFSQPGTSDKFDNGWDGRKFLGTNTAFIYASTPDGLMQVNTTDNLLGTYIYFVGNNDPSYTLTIKKTNLESQYQDMYLVDFVTNKVIPLDKEVVTYTFTASNNGTDMKRFQLRGGTVSTDDSADFNGLSAYIQQKSIYLQNKTNISGIAQIFDISGRMLFERNMNPNSDEYATSGLIPGVYIVKMTAGKYKNTIKLIIK